MGFGLKESLPRAKTSHGLRVKEAPFGKGGGEYATSANRIKAIDEHSIDWGWVLALGVPLLLLICFWTGILNVDKTAPVSETMSEGLAGFQNFTNAIMPGGNILFLVGIAAGVLMLFSAITRAIDI